MRTKNYTKTLTHKKKKKRNSEKNLNIATTVLCARQRRKNSPRDGFCFLFLAALKFLVTAKIIGILKL